MTANQNDLKGLINALDSGDYTTIPALADWYEDNDQPDLAEGFREIYKQKYIMWKTYVCFREKDINTELKKHDYAIPLQIFKYLKGKEIAQKYKDYISISEGMLDLARAIIKANND